jgi:glutaredoxin
MEIGEQIAMEDGSAAAAASRARANPDVEASRPKDRSSLMKTYLALCVVFLMMVLPAGGDLYTWTDADGVKHYTNEPPPTREGVEKRSEIKYSADQYDQWEEQRQTGQGRMIESGRTGAEAGAPAAAANERAAGKPGKVVMYATQRCKYCAQARAFFKEHAISYTEYDITADPEAREHYKKLNGNGVPLIFVGDTRVLGFNEGALRSLLGIGD